MMVVGAAVLGSVGVARSADFAQRGDYAQRGDLFDRADYPWCAQGQGYGYPGECSYQTLPQCQASVAGRFLICGPNPRMIGQPQYAPQFAPQYDPQYDQQYEPRRRHRRHHRRPRY